MESFSQALVVKWLKQVVECVCFKGSDGVLVVGSRKDYHRQFLSGQRLQDCKAIHIWQAYVQEEEIGFGLLQGGDGGGAIFTRGDHLDIGLGRKQDRELFTRRFFVIHDDGTQRSG